MNLLGGIYEPNELFLSYLYFHVNEQLLQTMFYGFNETRYYVFN